VENQGVEGFFVHFKKSHAYIRLTGENSALEVAKKLENKPWFKDTDIITKVEVIEDGEKIWKSLVSSLLAPKAKRRHKNDKRGGGSSGGKNLAKTIGKDNVKAKYKDRKTEEVKKENMLIFM